MSAPARVVHRRQLELPRVVTGRPYPRPWRTRWWQEDHAGRTAVGKRCGHVARGAGSRVARRLRVRRWPAASERRERDDGAVPACLARSPRRAVARLTVAGGVDAPGCSRRRRDRRRCRHRDPCAVAGARRRGGVVRRCPVPGGVVVGQPRATGRRRAGHGTGRAAACQGPDARPVDPRGPAGVGCTPTRGTTCSPGCPCCTCGLGCGRAGGWAATTANTRPGG